MAKTNEKREVLGDAITVTGFAQWAKILPHQRDFGNGADIDHTKYDGKYTIEVDIAEELANELSMKYNITINRRTGSGIPYLKASRKHKVETSEGDVKVNGPPPLFDRMGEPFNLPEGAELGNNSFVRVNMWAKPYGPGKKQKRALSITGIQVIDLKEFRNNAADAEGKRSPFKAFDGDVPVVPEPLVSEETL